MTNIYGQWARYYHELGYNTVPLTDRRCRVSGWERWCTEKQTPEDVDQLIAYASGEHWNGIGFPTGPINGVAIDIDSTNPLYISETQAIIGNCNLMRFGSKGYGAFFQYNPSIEKVSSAKGILYEVLSIGRYMAVPPSFHEKTKLPYRWLGTIKDNEIPESTELHPIDQDSLDVLRQYTEGFLARHPEAVPEKFRQERINHLSSPGGRNDKLRDVSYALAHKGVPLKQAIVELLEFDKRHHSPPWFTDKTEQHKKTPVELARQMVQRAFDKMIKIQEHKASKALCLNPDQRVFSGAEIEKFEMRDVLSQGTANAELGIAKSGLSSRTLEALDEIRLSAESLILPGSLFEDFHTYTKGHSSIDVPTLILGGGVTLGSVLAANTVELLQTRANIYVFQIATSGTGKNAPQNSITKLLTKSRNGPHFLGEGAMRSSLVAMEGLPKQESRNARLDIFDEISHLFEGAKLDHGRQLFDNLTRMFSESNGVMKKQSTRNEKTKIPVVGNPYVSLIGASTPSLIEFFDPKLFSKGFGGRVIMFYGKITENDLRNQKLFGEIEDVELDSEARKRLINAVDYFCGMKISDDFGTDDGLFDTRDTVTLYPCRQASLDPDVKKALLEYQIESTILANNVADPNREDLRHLALYAPVYARQAEIVRKLMIIHWIGTTGYMEAQKRAEMEGGELLSWPIVGPFPEVHIGWESFEWAKGVFDISLRSVRSFMENNPEADASGLRGGAIPYTIQGEFFKWLMTKPSGTVFYHSALVAKLKRLWEKYDKKTGFIREVDEFFGKTITKAEVDEYIVSQGTESRNSRSQGSYVKV